MAWVAIDRVARSIDEFGAGGDEGRRMLPHLAALAERIHDEVCERGFNPSVGAFTQSYGSTNLDASVLLIPHVGFLPGSDPRVQGTVAAVEKGLLRDGFVLRYATEHGTDGLPGTEGAFLACSFWLADNYAFTGRLQEAEALFERLLALRNPLGLLSEEYDPTLKRQISNFPQAFSHLALIMTARHHRVGVAAARVDAGRSPRSTRRIRTRERPRGAAVTVGERRAGFDHHRIAIALARLRGVGAGARDRGTDLGPQVVLDLGPQVELRLPERRHGDLLARVAVADDDRQARPGRAVVVFTVDVGGEAERGRQLAELLGGVDAVDVGRDVEAARPQQPLDLRGERVLVVVADREHRDLALRVGDDLRSRRLARVRGLRLRGAARVRLRRKREGRDRRRRQHSGGQRGP